MESVGNSYNDPLTTATDHNKTGNQLAPLIINHHEICNYGDETNGLQQSQAERESK